MPIGMRTVYTYAYICMHIDLAKQLAELSAQERSDIGKFHLGILAKNVCMERFREDRVSLIFREV